MVSEFESLPVFGDYSCDVAVPSRISAYISIFLAIAETWDIEADNDIAVLVFSGEVLLMIPLALFLFPEVGNHVSSE